MRRIGNRRQRLIIDVDEFGAIARLVEGFGNHQRHRIAHIAHPA